MKYPAVNQQAATRIGSSKKRVSKTTPQTPRSPEAYQIRDPENGVSENKLAPAGNQQFQPSESLILQTSSF
jgi:hypothetical protein